jgi:hypothetical protein
MINTFEAVVESESGKHSTSYGIISPIIARPVITSASLMCRRLLSMLALCLTVPFVAAIANAQDLTASASNAASPASGWWSPAGADTATAPQLLIGMGELSRFEASGLLGMSLAQPLNYLNEPSGASIADLPDLGSTLNANVAQQTEWAEPASLPAQSFLSLLQTRYSDWESILADSRSPTNVHGVSVYPVFAINYGNSHLPVTLYISPLRGGDGR